MEPLFRAYPALHDRITRIVGATSWCIIGASALLCDSDGTLYFELTKPKHWVWGDKGGVTIGIGGIGGSLELGETALECLYREVSEELSAEIEIASAETTYLVYEERFVESISLAAQESPCPALLTISENLYRRDTLPGVQVLAIATFVARLLDEPHLGDLYGLLSVSQEALGALFGSPEIRLIDALCLPGLHIATKVPIVNLSKRAGVKLSPVWTGRSLQVLLQGGHLSAEP